NNIIFVNSGLLRAFVEDQKGTVCTRIIAWENRFLTNITTFKHFNSSDEIIEALENSEIIYIEKDFFYQLLSTCPNLNSIYLNILSEYNELYIKKYFLYACKSLKEKILFLKDNFPHLIKRTNDTILASFLGVSRESYVRGKKYL
ncbi:Crp/Fnr family transcriptional regulator, partial [Riemerella anatipestifer]